MCFVSASSTYTHTHTHTLQCLVDVTRMSLDNQEDMLVADQLAELSEGFELCQDYNPIDGLIVPSSGDDFAFVFDNIDKSDIIDPSFFDNSIIEADIIEEICDDVNSIETNLVPPSTTQDTSADTAAATHLEPVIADKYKCKLCDSNFDSVPEIESHYHLEHADQVATTITTTTTTPTTTTLATTTTTKRRRRTKRKRLFVPKKTKKIVKKVTGKKKANNKSRDVENPRRYPCEWPNCTYVAKHSVRPSLISVYVSYMLIVHIPDSLARPSPNSFGRETLSMHLGQLPGQLHPGFVIEVVSFCEIIPRFFPSVVLVFCLICPPPPVTSLVLIFVFSICLVTFVLIRARSRTNAIGLGVR